MGNLMAPLGVDYTNANSLGDAFNLPYFYSTITNEFLDNKVINRINFPFVGIKKRRDMMRTYSDDNLPIVPPWGQRRLKRSLQSSADIRNAQQEDEVMRGKFYITRPFPSPWSNFYIYYLKLL